MEPDEIDLWIEIANEIKIDDKIYFLKKITRYEKYQELIERIITFCKFAIEKNEKIYWLYSH